MRETPRLDSLVTIRFKAIPGETALHLEDAGLDDEFAGVLAEAIRNDTQYEVYHLNGNSIRDRGISQIASALLENTTAKAIHIEDNLFGNEGIRYLEKLHAAKPLLAIYHGLEEERIDEAVLTGQDWVSATRPSTRSAASDRRRSGG